MLTKTYAVDFETYYDDELSITIQGAVNYARKTHIYLVSIVGPEIQYVGSVEKAPWWKIDGCHWVSHNAGFDMAVYKAACEKNQVPFQMNVYRETGQYEFPQPSNWDCTADLVAYLGVPRSLADAVQTLYNRTLDKAMRGSAKGKHWPEDFNPAQQERMLEYALRDSKECLSIWEDYSNQWPADEIAISRITRQRALQGVKVDWLELWSDLSRLKEVKVKALVQIPWSSTGTILSHKKVATYCNENGIPAPESLAEKSEECQAWEETYGEAHPIVGAIRDYRKANRLESIVRGMIDRVMVNGRMNFGLKYFGAHTGRWSGTDGLNMQNPNKEPVFGVDLRARIIADEGMKFVIADYSQIEPRCAAWLVRDNKMLDALKEGYGIYESFARAVEMWEGKPGTMKKTAKDLYALAKAQVLALGYGAGPAKFILMARMYAGLEISLEESQRIVGEYREKNYLIPKEWRRLENGMHMACRLEEPYIVQLPSGRSLTYTDIGYRTVRLERDENGPRPFPRKVLMGRQGYSKEHHAFWGGKLFENVVQATARDVLANGILRLEEAGIPVLWSAHDEVVIEAPKSFDSTIVRDIMTTTPKWLEGVVLEVDMVESDHYLK